MFYLFTRMSEKWFCQEMEDLDDIEDMYLDNIKEHVNQGNVIAIADDKEGFAEAVGIEVEDIEDVE